MVGAYQAFHERSIRDPDGFWGEQAGLIDWNKPFSKVLDYGRPPWSGARPLCRIRYGAWCSPRTGASSNGCGLVSRALFARGHAARRRDAA